MLPDALLCETAKFLALSDHFQLDQEKPLAEQLEACDPVVFRLFTPQLFHASLQRVNGDLDALDERVKTLFKQHREMFTSLDISAVAWEHVPKIVCFMGARKFFKLSLPDIPLQNLKQFIESDSERLQALVNKCDICTLRLQAPKQKELSHTVAAEHLSSLLQHVDKTKVKELHLSGVRLDLKTVTALVTALPNVVRLFLDSCCMSYVTVEPEVYGGWTQLEKVTVVAECRAEYPVLSPGRKQFFERLFLSLPKMRHRANDLEIAQFQKEFKQAPKNQQLCLEVTQEAAVFTKKAVVEVI